MFEIMFQFNAFIFQSEILSTICTSSRLFFTVICRQLFDKKNPQDSKKIANLSQAPTYFVSKQYNDIITVNYRSVHVLKQTMVNYHAGQLLVEKGLRRNGVSTPRPPPGWAEFTTIMMECMP
jgi:hypothetical protein